MICKILKIRDAYLKDETGATAVEYALIIGLIAIALISSMTILGNNIGGTLNDTGDTIGKAG